MVFFYSLFCIPSYPMVVYGVGCSIGYRVDVGRYIMYDGMVGWYTG